MKNIFVQLEEISSRPEPFEFDLILMIMCDFCALSPSQRMVMLRKFQSLLSPGGALLLDVYSLIAFKQREEATSYGALGGRLFQTGASR